MTPPLDVLRATLAGTPAWIVGGAVRDRLLGRATDDVDVALAGDVREVAKSFARSARAAVFPLSESFGAWRVVGRDQAWHVDLLPLKDGDLAADLGARDLTVNAMAEPLGGGDVVDLHGGRADLDARVLRMVSPQAFSDDPLRTLRVVRLAVELGFAVDPETLAAARAFAPLLERVAPERILAELRRIVAAEDPLEGLRLLEDAGATAQVLPELLRLHDVAQNVFHHRDVHDHTLEVLAEVAALQADPSPLGPAAGAVDALLNEPLADGMTRWDAMRWAALLHDIAKPATRAERPDGRVTFFGHDAEGAEVARRMLRRLRAAQKVVDHVAHLTRHHLRLGFLVHERPLDRRAVHRYLVATAPYSVDVTVLTVADRLATRGRNAETAIAAHLELAREMLVHATEAPLGEPLVRGHDVAAALGREPGPWLGDVLRALEEDRYAGEITTREQALARARELATGHGSAHGTP